MPTNADDLRAFLRTRRSIRRFQPTPIADEVIARLIATATHAPSAHNLQPWRFVVVPTSRSTPAGSVGKDRLAHALTSAMRADMASEGAPVSEIDSRVANSIRRIEQAPVLILLCRDRAALRADTPEEHIMSIQSAAAAGTYLLLAAHAEGLGANWICWPLYAQEETREALSLPESWEPQAMYILGYADEEPKEKRVRPVEEVVQN